MSDYRHAIEFQRAISEAARDHDWLRPTVEAMRESGLDKTDANNALGSIIYLLNVPTLYYFTRESFEHMNGFPWPEKPSMLIDVLPSAEGMLIFQDDVILNEGDRNAYCAVMWRKNVGTVLLTDRDVEEVATMILFVFRQPRGESPESYYLSPLLLAVVEGNDTVITPGYNYRSDLWKEGTTEFLNRVGAISLFLQSRVADTTEHKHRTSRVSGRKKITQITSIKVVTLRAIERTEQPSASEPHHVDWSCRWTVREHDRHLRDGRVIKVRGHQKGPADRPLREYAATVYDVSR